MLRLAVRVLAVAGTLALQAVGGRAQDVTLTFSHFLGPTSFFQVDVAEPWARSSRSRRKGAVKVEIHNATSPLGKIFEQANQVRAGTVDIALGLRGAEGERFPGSSMIELPFVVKDAASGSRALWFGNLLQDRNPFKRYKDYGVLALFVHNPGLIHTTTRRVVSPSDLKGLRLRSPNKTVAAALEHLGATPVILQVHEVMDAVRDNRIDGIVTNWGNPLQGFNDHMKFHTDTQFYSAAFFIVINPAKYASLPSDVRAAIDELSGWHGSRNSGRSGTSGTGRSGRVRRRRDTRSSYRTGRRWRSGASNCSR